jgi:hypothetical protein
VNCGITATSQSLVGTARFAVTEPPSWGNRGDADFVHRRLTIYSFALLVWFVFLVVAFTLGAMRELVIRPLIGELPSHIVGTLTVVAVFLGIQVVFVRRMGTRGGQVDFWLVGLLWLLMTASFEFLFFHYVGGKPWEEILADYNLAQGRIWVFVLLVTALGPPTIHSLISRGQG